MKRLLVVACLLVITIRARAQNPVEFQNVIAVSTVSPNAASLGKFGNIPVSYQTGIPSITIPLYNIVVGKINIPISLDYHSGGIRVDEISSSVGTGWALNGIGLVSRNMVGLPDENNGGYLSAPSLDSLYNYYEGSMYGPAKDMSYAQYIYDVRDGIKDTQPDIFSYNLNGSSGKFVFRPDGTIMQIPITNNRIERTTGNNFKITDEAGMVYIFDQQEQTEMVSASAIGPGTYVSSWRLSKLVDANTADTISFTYISGSATTQHSYNFSYELGSDANGADVTGEKSSISTTTHYGLFPSGITWRGGKITFKNAMDRTDVQTEYRLDSVKVYAKNNGAYQLIKNIKLYQSYFYSNPINGATATNKNYRLRLDSVASLPVLGSAAPQTYKMAYNNDPIAPNESFAQDQWGFNNGKFNNPSLMPQQTVLYQNLYRTIGEANMDPDSTNTFVEACMLQSIKYPTKGTSTFTFEPHRYPVNYQTTQQQSVGCDTYGSVQSTNTTTFTVAANQSAFAYSVTLSAYNYQDVTDRPQVKMIDQTTGQQVFFVNNVNNPSQSYSTGTIALNLTVGHTYVITTNIYTTDPNVTATCLVTWSVPVSGIAIKYGGGLRVSSITNYDNNGKFINKDTYQYGDNGAGSLLTAASYLLVNYENTFYEHGAQLAGGENIQCTIYQSSNNIIYHNNSVYPATQFSGSPVVYSGVTKFSTDSLGINPNGKTIFTYILYDDQAALPETNYGKYGVLLISNLWKNGYPRGEYTYKRTGASYQPIHIKLSNYQVYRPDTLLGLKIKPLYIKDHSNSGQLLDCEQVPDTGKTRSQTHFFLSRIPTYTGAMLLQSESDTTFDDAGNKVVVVHNNYYDDLTHIFPTRKETFSSKNDTLVDVIKYPHDLAATGNVYQTMLSRNMVSPTVSFVQQKNGSQLTLTNINYNDWFSNGNLLLPQSADAQSLTDPLERRVNFDKYDQYGNILQQEKANAPSASYQWGYNSQYPVAKAVNAKCNDIFYDSFEEGDGNSSIGDAKTGHYSYSGSYSKLLTGLDTGSYTLTYWKKTGSTWAWQAAAISVTGSSYTISLTGQIDDVRFYPSTAQMSTYTYDPEIGMTSATDIKGEVTTYEYDGFQRLVTIRDKDGNILKHFDYHYKVQ